jgi:hypothetical protein
MAFVIPDGAFAPIRNPERHTLILPYVLDSGSRLRRAPE